MIKPTLYSMLEEQDLSLNLMIIYQYEEVADFNTIFQGLQKGLDAIVSSADNGPASESH